jgi:hypothetical protein
MTRFFNLGSLCSTIIYSAGIAAGGIGGETFEKHLESQFNRFVVGLAEYEVAQVRSQLRFMLPAMASASAGAVPSSFAVVHR